MCIIVQDWHLFLPLGVIKLTCLCETTIRTDSCLFKQSGPRLVFPALSIIQNSGLAQLHISVHFFFSGVFFGLTLEHIIKHPSSSRYSSCLPEGLVVRSHEKWTHRLVLKRKRPPSVAKKNCGSRSGSSHFYENFVLLSYCFFLKKDSFDILSFKISIFFARTAEIKK